MNTPASSRQHQVTLRQRMEIAERTMAFQFEKPSGFTFRPGQYLDVTLINPAETDVEGNIRTFSIASAPHEETLMVATRLRDTAFKRTLAALSPGAEVLIDSPGGSFTLHNNAARTAVFIVGGIGVTPVRSMLVAAAHEHLPHRVLMLYLNRRPQDAAFLDELTGLQASNPNFRLVPVMTAVAEAGPGPGEHGPFTAEVLRTHTTDAVSPVYYVVGPPGMVNGVHGLLNGIGVDDDDIRLEDFGGY